ncbi:MAG TPA: hypothetical protein VM658_01410 [bacterium]|nr:hypothetical protein [bacterium]
MEVKGTMLLNYIKLIRANRGRAWDQYLKPEDWEIINGHVYASNRYPYEAFRRIGFAVFKVIANSNLDVTRAFGRFNMKTLLETYSTSLLAAGDPLASLKKLAASKRVFMADDSDSKMADHGDNWARIIITMPSQESDHERTLAFCHQYAGHLEELVEQAGAKKPSATVSPKDRTYEVMIKWE